MLKILKWNRESTECPEKKIIVLIFAIKNTPPHVFLGILLKFSEQLK